MTALQLTSPPARGLPPSRPGLVSSPVTRAVLPALYLRFTWTPRFSASG